MKFLTLAALALTFAACSSDDNDIIQQPARQPAEITITATIDAKDGAMTRASMNDDNDNIWVRWEDTDEFAILFNDGTTEVKRIATVVSSTITSSKATITFTVPATLGDNTDCKIVYPATAANATNDGVKTYAELMATQDGELSDKLDVRYGTGTINKGTATLSVNPDWTQQFAIFKFTLSGTAIDATHPLYIKDGSDDVVTTVTPTTSRQVIYVAMPANGVSTTYKFQAETANNIIVKSGPATIYPGTFYKTRLNTPGLGDLYYSDGSYSSVLQTGKTPIGVIAYLGNDGCVESKANGGGHGLVLCLRNASDEAEGMEWSRENVSNFAGQEVTDFDGLMRTENVSGYTNTAALTEEEIADQYPAASAAKNYATLPAPASTTGWFLPSAQQWVKVQMGLGRLKDGEISWDNYSGGVFATAWWDEAMSKAGAINYDRMTIENMNYWTSSESSASEVVVLGYDSAGFTWKTCRKDDYCHVRPMLAF